MRQREAQEKLSSADAKILAINDDSKSSPAKGIHKWLMHCCLTSLTALRMQCDIRNYLPSLSILLIFILTLTVGVAKQEPSEEKNSEGKAELEKTVDLYEAKVDIAGAK
jgi:hypothetical protein